MPSFYLKTGLKVSNLSRAQVSSFHPRDGVASVDDAQDICAGQGARLWEPRVTSAVTNLLATDLSKSHFYWMANSYTATGLRVVNDGTGGPDVIYGSDNTTIPSVLREFLPWKTGYPMLSGSKPCVGIEDGEFLNIPCDGYEIGIRNRESFAKRKL